MRFCIETTMCLIGKMCDACPTVGNGVTIIHTALTVSQHRHWTSKVVSITRVGQLLVRCDGSFWCSVYLRVPLRVRCERRRSVWSWRRRSGTDVSWSVRSAPVCSGSTPPACSDTCPRYAADTRRHAGDTRETHRKHAQMGCQPTTTCVVICTRWRYNYKAQNFKSLRKTYLRNVQILAL